MFVVVGIKEDQGRAEVIVARFCSSIQSAEEFIVAQLIGESSELHVAACVRAYVAYKATWFRNFMAGRIEKPYPALDGISIRNMAKTLPLPELCAVFPGKSRRAICAAVLRGLEGRLAEPGVSFSIVENTRTPADDS